MHPRDQITLIIDKIYRSGLTTTSGGNISIIDKNGDIWVTSSAICFPSKLMQAVAAKNT